MLKYKKVIAPPLDARCSSFSALVKMSGSQGLTLSLLILPMPALLSLWQFLFMSKTPNPIYTQTTLKWSPLPQPLPYTLDSYIWLLTRHTYKKVLETLQRKIFFHVGSLCLVFITSIWHFPRFFPSQTPHPCPSTSQAQSLTTYSACVIWQKKSHQPLVISHCPQAHLSVSQASACLPSLSFISPLMLWVPTYSPTCHSRDFWTPLVVFCGSLLFFPFWMLFLFLFLANTRSSLYFLKQTQASSQH